MKDCVGPDLTKATQGSFLRSRPRLIEALWIVTEFLLVTNPLQPSSRLRAAALRFFGAIVGRNVILRPRLRVKYPWNIVIGDNSWVGEGVWIHNQDKVYIGKNTVISQETFITTGSHDIYGGMDLQTAPVVIGDGVWVTSRCIVLPGVEIGNCAVITPGSVVHKSLQGNALYGGNPAVFLRPRVTKSSKPNPADKEKQ